MTALSELGDLIRNKRMARGLTQCESSRTSGVSRPTIAWVEVGELISAMNLLKLAAALDVSIERR